LQPKQFHMKETNLFKLISGDFSPEEANEILTHHFTTKIKFHQAKNFSSIERFGSNDKTALKRIPELSDSLVIIQQLIKNAEKNNDKITIQSEVSISISKK
jgi:hypothetical protein